MVKLIRLNHGKFASKPLLNPFMLFRSNTFVGELNENEVKSILQRAEQIHNGANSDNDSETAALLRAAEEAGLPREAVELALQERLSTEPLQCEEGDLVFAPRSDGIMYVAQVVLAKSSVIKVRFSNGSELTLPDEKVVKADFQIGAKVQAFWPVHNWHMSTVIAFDKAEGTVKLADGWGFTKSFPLSEIRLPRQRNMLRSLAGFWQKNYTYFLAGIGIMILAVLLIKR